MTEYEAPEFTDKKEFKQFLSDLESVVTKRMTVPEIRREFEAKGLEYYADMIYYALEWSDKIKEDGSRHFIPTEPKISTEPSVPYADTMSKLFVKTGERPAKEKPFQVSVYGKDSEYGYK